MMYMAASHALEVVTGVSVATYLKEKIWAPLGMNSTYFDTDEALRAQKGGEVKLALGYGWESGGVGQDGEYVPQPLMHFPEVSGAGHIITSTEDYSKWMASLLNPTSKTPVSQKLLDELFYPRIVSEAKVEPYRSVETYALGWFLRSYRGEELISQYVGHQILNSILC
jgi:CubicO group peptidase (beta-lactamase class C family)